MLVCSNTVNFVKQVSIEYNQLLLPFFAFLRHLHFCAKTDMKQDDKAEIKGKGTVQKKKVVKYQERHQKSVFYYPT